MRLRDLWRSRHFWRGVAAGAVFGAVVPWWALFITALPVAMLMNEVDMIFDLRDRLDELEPPKARAFLKGDK